MFRQLPADEMDLLLAIALSQNPPAELLDAAEIVAWRNTLPHMKDTPQPITDEVANRVRSDITINVRYRGIELAAHQYFTSRNEGAPADIIKATKTQLVDMLLTAASTSERHYAWSRLRASPAPIGIDGRGLLPDSASRAHTTVRQELELYERIVGVLPRLLATAQGFHAESEARTLGFRVARNAENGLYQALNQGLFGKPLPVLED